MEFKGPCIQAMYDRAPKMLRDLQRRGLVERHLQKKSEEAHRMFDELTKDAPKLPNGFPAAPHASQAERLVLETLIEFPPE